MRSPGVSFNPLLRSPAQAHIFFFRATPLLSQLFLVYFGSGQFREAFEAVGLWGVLREAWWCALIAFSLNTAAYQAEILRGGIEGAPAGEVEAASALASVIAIYDLMDATRAIFARHFALEMFVYAAVLYLGLTFLVSCATAALEAWLNPQRAREA